ncbi:unnamed protein product [Cercopithifilaria johnstoni]|uniref:Uncharacterized protein n=1 Tax=Cercopithifilaria johnstoni TaxID=2874296 RepID=A0A8J2PV10_9BILA|nr:unnamed protein product [Cercopithifilaria johnstoni]
MRELVPVDLPWKRSEEIYRQAQYFCIKPDRSSVKCKSPLGCYQIRYTSLAVSNNLPAGCISDIDETLLEKYPYLALCSSYLKNGFARKCFYTDTRDEETAMPLIVCCCNMNPYNDCPLHARISNLGYVYKTNERKRLKSEISFEKKKKGRGKGKIN